MKSLLEVAQKASQTMFFSMLQVIAVILFRKKWSDRGTGTSEDAEIHTTDTLNEKAFTC